LALYGGLPLSDLLPVEPWSSANTRHRGCSQSRRSRLSSSRSSPVRAWSCLRATVDGWPSFLPILYRPTLARSYRLGLKNRFSRRVLAESAVGGSPGRSLR